VPFVFVCGFNGFQFAFAYNLHENINLQEGLIVLCFVGTLVFVSLVCASVLIDTGIGFFSD